MRCRGLAGAGLQRAAAPSLLLLRRANTAPCSLALVLAVALPALHKLLAWDSPHSSLARKQLGSAQAPAAAAFTQVLCCKNRDALKWQKAPVQAPVGKRLRALFTRGRAAWRWRSTRARACKKHFGPASAGIAPAAARRLGQPHSHRQQRSHERAAPQGGGHADRCACWAKNR